MRDVMVDLETMGNGPLAAIVAIGATAFDAEAGTIGPTFYRAVDLASAVQLGGQMDADTVLWWLKQGDEARAAICGGGDHITRVLLDFTDWAQTLCHPADLRLWGNGATFDNVILASAYRAAQLERPWHFWNDRCYRTVKAENPGVPVERVGVLHNAAHDAETQARHLVAIMGARRPPPASGLPQHIEGAGEPQGEKAAARPVDLLKTWVTPPAAVGAGEPVEASGLTAVNNKAAATASLFNDGRRYWAVGVQSSGLAAERNDAAACSTTANAACAAATGCEPGRCVMTSLFHRLGRLPA